MNGIIINIDPVALHFNGFEIRWYAIAIMLAMIAAFIISIKWAVKKGLKTDYIVELFPWVIGAGIVGARMFHVIDRWEDYAASPLHIFLVGQGGLAIWGGVAGGVLAAFIFAKIKRIPFGRLADTLVPGLLVAQIIGRIACIINGDAYGAPASLPWSFQYVHPDSFIPPHLYGIPTHPYPLYEMLWNGATLLLLLKLRPRLKQDGLLFISYIVAYSIGRFILTFVRQEKVWFWGLQEAQILSIVIVLASLAVIFWLRRKGDRDNRVLIS